MFKVIIVVHAVSSGWQGTYAVNPEYPSFTLCEASRLDLADDFKQFLERRHFQPFKVDTTCVKNDEFL
jgi:hypothetical protein